MPQAAIVAGIGAGASLGGAYLAGRGASRAAEASESAAREAIAYQRERDASRSSRYDAAYEDYQRRYDQWLQQFYGVTPTDRRLGSGQPSPQGGAVPISIQPGEPNYPTPAPAEAGPRFGAMGAPAGQPAVPLVPQRPRTMADLAGWNQWNRYGVGG